MSETSIEVSEIHWLMDMFQTVDVGLVVLNCDYRIQVWNGFMENHSGLTPRQVRDCYLFDLFSEIDEDWLRRKCDPVLLLKNRAFTIWEQRPYIFRFKNYRPITGNADYMYQNSTIFPITDTRGPSVSTMTLRQSTSSAVPCTELPAPSRARAARRASQLPISDQPIAAETIAARAVFSITA